MQSPSNGFMSAMGQADRVAEAAIRYRDFLASKAQEDSYGGFAPDLPEFLFPFQRELVEWACRKGKAAIFADCGLGKTPMQLVLADNFMRRTNKPVLILTPLAVARQTIREGEKFGIECSRSKGENVGKAKILVSNYEQIHKFDPGDFGGVICDESSAIKNFNGRRRSEVTEFLRTVPYRHLCTATAAPNDYIELGTSSEALGQLGHIDMLNRFFRNTQNTTDVKGNAALGRPKWRFKGHAETAFWRWVVSWARAIRKPSDLGFSDDGFELPPLIVNEHIVETRTLAPGMLFALPAKDMIEEREERRRTIDERCEKAAELVAESDSAVIWCHLNDEGKALARLIPDAREIAGSTPDDQKEEIYDAFSSGQLAKIITKPKIGAWGLNWQHCNKVVTFASHSYEQYYQSVRRCWRFGQKRAVTVDLVVTEGEIGIKENLHRKSDQAERMFDALVARAGEAMAIDPNSINYETETRRPSWL